jgi:integrase
MGRRVCGEGSIYPVRDKEGNVKKWACSVSLGFIDGKRIRKKVERRTRKEVADEIASLKKQQAQGVNLKAKQPTVKDHYLPWLENTFALKARPKSVETYRQMFTYYILPALGTMKLKDVTHRKVQALVAQMHADGLATKTISLMRAAGRQAWKKAMQEGLCDSNPFQDLTLPAADGKKIVFLTVEQAKAFILAARGDRLEVALRLLLSLGMRRGEVCGLRWGKDVDLAAGTLTINGTLQYIQGHGLEWGEPKTDAGRRSYKLPASIVAALTWHKQRQDQERTQMGARWSDSGYVFCSSTTGGALNSNLLYGAFKKAAAIAGLPKEASPHSLRHSCASFLHAEGASLKKISSYLGHSNTAITSNVYVHLFQDEIDEGVVTVEELLYRDAM